MDTCVLDLLILYKFYTNLFSAKEYKKNDKLILKYFQQNLNKLKWWKSIMMSAINIENLKP